MKRYIAIIMAALMILGCIFSMSSCWMLKKEDEQISESEVEEPEGELAKLESKDLGGTEFTILAREEFKYEALPDSDANDWISQKIYYRNSLVENKYNVKLDVRLVPGIWVNRTQYKTAIKSAVEMGGACDYDIISGAQNQISNYVTEGMFTNLYNDAGTLKHYIYYIGKTTDYDSRFYRHHKENQLKHANPNCIAIHACNKQEMDKLEVEWIEFWKPIYNIQHNS